MMHRGAVQCTIRRTHDADTTISTYPLFCTCTESFLSEMRARNIQLARNNSVLLRKQSTTLLKSVRRAPFARSICSTSCELAAFSFLTFRFFCRRIHLKAHHLARRRPISRIWTHTNLLSKHAIVNTMRCTEFHVATVCASRC